MTSRKYGDEPADTKGPGWFHDEKGRPYRDEKGTRIYQRQEDRDAALAETYRLSAVLRVLCGCTEGIPDSVPALVSANGLELAELFWREAPTTAGNDVRTKFAQWCEKNFGRELERGARQMLWFEVKSREIGSTTRTLGLFASVAEQQRFERAAAEMPRWLGNAEGDDEVFAENSLARVDEIVFRATGKRISPQSMGRPLSARQWERRKKLLLEQAQKLAAKSEGVSMLETLK